MRTQEFNRRYLSSARSVRPSVVQEGSLAHNEICLPNATCGRAQRGSRKQLQDYVSDFEADLTSAVMEKLPTRLKDLGTNIRWVSPLALDNFVEYRDRDFLRAVGLGEFTSTLDDFWPANGPSWDALGIVSDTNGRIRPGVILLEAKSHVTEIYGSGCKAGTVSRNLIEKSLFAAKNWCGASLDADWTGALYQSANRLAHLYFIRERLKHPAWLVNLYFLNDPIGPADQMAWASELERVKRSLGLKSPAPFTVDVFLPALSSEEAPPSGEKFAMLGEKAVIVSEIDGGSDSVLPRVSGCQPARSGCGDGQFAGWANSWMALAGYEGAFVPDVSRRIEQLVQLWQAPIPGGWARGIDSQLMECRYRRGDLAAPHAGEHAIEHDVLYRNFELVSIFGYNLIDGFNAVPLVRDEHGGRSGNVEADMFLLAKRRSEHRLFLCEVKSSSNNSWYAAIESLRQLKLVASSPESLGVFSRRNPDMHLPSQIPVTALVLAPELFYLSPGKKANAVKPTLDLLRRFTSEFGIDLRLAVWSAQSASVREFSVQP